ncbi:MAG TPA: hypothetical protein VF209_03930 [Patescibacteria group bacterium]
MAINLTLEALYHEDKADRDKNDRGLSNADRLDKNDQRRVNS